MTVKPKLPGARPLSRAAGRASPPSAGASSRQGLRGADLDPALARAVEVALAGHTSPTRVVYQTAFARFCRAARVTGLADLRTMTIARARAARVRLAADYADGTCAQTVLSTRVVLGALQLAGARWWDDLEVGRRSPPPDWNVLMPADRERMLARAAGEPRDLAVLLTLVNHGWRASELARLRWADLGRDDQGDWVANFKGKGGRVFRRGVRPEVVGAASAWCEAGEGRMFIPRDRRRPDIPLTRFDIYRIVRRWSLAVGHRVSPHGLRATYISDVIGRRGIEAARQLAGHASLLTTQRYSRWKILKDLD